MSTDVRAAAETSPELTMSRTLAATPEQVYDAWTQAEQLASWWGPRGFTLGDHALDVRPGGQWRTVMVSPEGQEHIVAGRYLELDRPRKLAFTWAWETDGSRGHETVVTVELEPDGEGTRMSFTQRTFESAEACQRHHEGWDSSFGCLDDLFE